MDKLNQSAVGDVHLDGVLKLKAGCHHSLSQCKELLDRITEEDYNACSDHSSSIGGHFRHILDRFQSFFNGLSARRIDYDARARDKAIEVSLASAKFALTLAQRQLDTLSMAQMLAEPLLVSETVHYQGFTVQVSSTAERELMSLVTHSIHHLAIIALLAKGMGYSVDAGFGKAPSTILFEIS